MALNGITFDNRTAQSANDGAVLYGIAGQDYILNGCAITITSSSFVVASGHFLVCGRNVNVDGATEIACESIPSTGYARLKFVIDLTQAASTGAFTQGSFAVEYSTTTVFPELTREDVNNGGSTYELEMAIASIASGVLATITKVLSNIEGLNGKQCMEYNI